VGGCLTEQTAARRSPSPATVRNHWIRFSTVGSGRKGRAGRQGCPAGDRVAAWRAGAAGVVAACTACLAERGPKGVRILILATNHIDEVLPDIHIVGIG
jgi:hypothetical protein